MVKVEVVEGEDLEVQEEEREVEVREEEERVEVEWEEEERVERGKVVVEEEVGGGGVGVFPPWALGGMRGARGDPIKEREEITNRGSSLAVTPPSLGVG